MKLNIIYANKKVKQKRELGKKPECIQYLKGTEIFLDNILHAISMSPTAQFEPFFTCTLFGGSLSVLNDDDLVTGQFV